jgi:hypothetical protein
MSDCRTGFTRRVRRAGFGSAILALCCGPIASAGAATSTRPTVAVTVATGSYPTPYVVAMRNALAMNSFHEQQTIRSQGWMSVNEGDAVVNGGTETDVIRSAGTQFGFTARLFNAHFYLNADQETLVSIANLSAFNGGFNAGRWLIVPPSAKIYSELSFGIDVESAIAQIELGSPITVGKTTTFFGRPVVPLTSTTGLHASTTQGLQHGRFTLYVSPGAHSLPVAEVIDDTVNKVAQSVTLLFSRWNQPVTIAKPATTRSLP